LVTIAGAHPQAICTSFNQPHEQGFIAAINWKLAEKVNVQKNHNENHPARQARYVLVAGSIPDSAEIKGKQALVSACFSSGGRI
jgi:hypothetical protein